MPTASGVAARLLTECESCISEDNAISTGRSTFLKTHLGSGCHEKGFHLARIGESGARP